MDRDEVLKFIRIKGPILPVQLASELKKDLIITGAVLSELASSKLILISNTKVGGSPVYYMKEQAFKLQDLYKYLNEKDKKAYDLLKKEKLLRDVKLSPLLRVALRGIKDFARPIEVTIGKTKELFWRWYMITPEEASAMLRAIFRPEKPKPAPIVKPVQDKPATEEPKPAVQTNVQKTLAPEVPVGDDLYNKTKKYLDSKGIDILEFEIIRKKSELDFVLSVPSAVGDIKYYCKARSKKRCSDTDLAGVFVNAQLKKLPGLFLISGDLTKKAKEKLEKEFDNIKVKKI